MKNKLEDLNNHLFAQLEGICDETVDGEKLVENINRAKAVVAISDKIIATADLNLKAAALIAQHGTSVAQNLPLISNNEFATPRQKPQLIKAAGT